MDKQLDPKLKEIYDRVMGTNIKPASQTISVNQAQPQTTPQSSPPQPQTPVSPPPTPIVNAPSPVPKPLQTAKTEEQKYQLFQAKQPQAGAVQTNGKAKKISPLIFVVIFIFFIGYSLFWVKFFNIQLPFPLPF